MKIHSSRIYTIIWLLNFFCLFPLSSAHAAIGPDQLLLVVNGKTPQGMELARYYREKRHVPKENMIIIKTSLQEEISRKQYNQEIAEPIRKYLLKNDPFGKRYACLVLFYGVPLRIRSDARDAETQKRLETLQVRLASLNAKLQKNETADGAQDTALHEETSRIEEEISSIHRNHDGAAVDSEIALVMEDGYSLKGWLPNKYFIGFQRRHIPGMPRKVLPVSRLDGPSKNVVRRMIDDSLFAEKHGLSGTAYFDARWPLTGKAKSPYELYDAAIHNTENMIRKLDKMPVVLDERSDLFGPGEAKGAALYCGWYSLAKYVDAFTWARGAVGYHVASAECTTLKDAGSTVWCLKMLENGVAATLGPVAEPYLQSFPAPEVFFSMLLQGRTLMESFVVSNPFWSWQMVLIGDPLYRPFASSTAN